MKTIPLSKEIATADADRRRVLVEVIRLAGALLKFCDDNDIGQFYQKDGCDGTLMYTPQRDKR